MAVDLWAGLFVTAVAHGWPNPRQPTRASAAAPSRAEVTQISAFLFQTELGCRARSGDMPMAGRWMQSRSPTPHERAQARRGAASGTLPCARPLESTLEGTLEASNAPTPVTETALRDLTQ